MFGRNCFKMLGLVCLVLPFSGCSSTEIDAITISPAVTDFEGLGGQVQLTAIATINHGNHPATFEDVTDQVKWSTPLSTVISISSSGKVTATGIGLTQAVGTMNGFQGVISGNATICAQLVNPGTGGFTCATSSAAEKPAARLSIPLTDKTPATPGETRQFTAIKTAPTGEEENLTDGVIWTSSDKSVATVDETGQVTALSAGKATIVASMKNSDGTVMAVATLFTVKE